MIQYLHTLKRYLVLIIIFTVLSTAAGFILAVRSPRVYSASSTILVNSRAKTPLVTDQSLFNDIPTDLNLIRTPAVTKYACDLLLEKGLHIPPAAVSSVVLPANIPGTNMINITAEWGEPKTCAAVANAVANGLERYQRDQAKLGDKDTATFLGQQVEDARSKLAAAERGVQRFKEQMVLNPIYAAGVAVNNGTQYDQNQGNPPSTEGNGGNSPRTGSGQGYSNSGGSGELVSIQGALEDAQMDYEATRRHLADVKGKVAHLNGLLASQNSNAIRDNTSVRSLQEQLNTKQMELASALAQYTPQGVERFYPGLQAEINNLRNRLRQATSNLTRGDMVDLEQQQNLTNQVFQDETRLDALQSRIASLQRRASSLRTSVALGPAQETRLNQLTREQGVMEGIYRMLLERQKQAEISMASDEGNITVVSYAEPPQYPVRPNRTKDVTTAFLLGIILGCSLAYLLDYLDNTVRRRTDITDTLGLPLLGVVPLTDVEPAQVWNGNTRSLAAEAYRMLRSNIDFVNVDAPVKVILVTSAAPSEGKSSTVANMAASMAQVGKRVVVVDADLRRPSIHRLLGGGRTSGLAEALSGLIDFDDAIRESNIPGVWTVPVEKIPPNPAELLSTQRMRDLIAHLRDNFDIVLLDSPPCLMVADAAVLASFADATIQVVAAGKTSRDAVARGRELLTNAHGTVVGVILNRFNAKNDHTYDYSYYYYYYYNEDQKPKRLKWPSKNPSASLEQPEE